MLSGIGHRDPAAALFGMGGMGCAAGIQRNRSPVHARCDQITGLCLYHDLCSFLAGDLFRQISDVQALCVMVASIDGQLLAPSPLPLSEVFQARSGLDRKQTAPVSVVPVVCVHCLVAHNAAMTG
jgi:hypothetical protein